MGDKGVEFQLVNALELLGIAVHMCCPLQCSSEQKKDSHCGGCSFLSLSPLLEPQQQGISPPTGQLTEGKLQAQRCAPQHYS